MALNMRKNRLSSLLIRARRMVQVLRSSKMEAHTAQKSHSMPNPVRSLDSCFSPRQKHKRNIVAEMDEDNEL
jgi:hypothetical protein